MNQGFQGNHRRRDGGGVNTASGSNYWKNPWNPSVLRPFNSLIRDIYIIFRERLLTIQKSIHFVGQNHRPVLMSSEQHRQTSTTRPFVTDNGQPSLTSNTSNSSSNSLPSLADNHADTCVECKSPLSSEDEELSDEEGVVDIDQEMNTVNIVRQPRSIASHGSTRSGSQSRRKFLPPGLCNNGNLCFLNSTLQALASVPSFVATLNSVVGRQMNVQTSSVSAALISVLQLLNGEERTSIESIGQTSTVRGRSDRSVPPKAVDPSMLADLIRKHQVRHSNTQSAWPSTSPSMLGSGAMLQEQQDAQELLQALIQALTEESIAEHSLGSIQKTPTLKDMLDMSSGPSLSSSMTAGSNGVVASVAGVLGGWFGTSIECGSCGYKRPIANSPFVSMTLSLSERAESSVSIESCISALTAPEWLRGVECSQCTVRQQITELEEKVIWLKESLSLERIIEDAEEAEEMKQELDTAMKSLCVLRGPRSESACLCGQNCVNEADCMVLPVRSSICKRLLISRLPSVLILHINRQEFCPNSGMPRKSQKSVAFGLELDMSSFLSFGGADWRAVSRRQEVTGEGDLTSSSLSSSFTHPKLMKSKSKGGIIYDLCAVIQHHGGAVGGHYTTFRKVKSSSSDGDSWVHASDLQVEATTEARVLACEAYLLFYERREVQI